jgi:hypothetical protein
MESNPVKINAEMMVDANAAAGLLMDIFGREMTNEPTECAHCGDKTKIGTLFTSANAHGAILRCPVCKNIMLRIVQTPADLFLDARGAVFLQMSRKLQG